jgi:hypothetical protein
VNVTAAPLNHGYGLKIEGSATRTDIIESPMDQDVQHPVALGVPVIPEDSPDNKESSMKIISTVQFKRILHLKRSMCGGRTFQ